MTAPEATHAVALAELCRWAAPSQPQEQLRRDFVTHLEEHPDGVWRECRPDHVTASMLVLSADRREVLLGLHRKVGLWLQMGGHLEPGDADLRAAAQREALEECGLSELTLLSGGGPVGLDRHAAPCSPDARWHLDVRFAGLAAPDALPLLSEESIDLRWWPVEALPADTDLGLRSLIAAAVAAPG